MTGEYDECMGTSITQTIKEEFGADVSVSIEEGGVVCVKSSDLPTEVRFDVANTMAYVVLRELVRGNSAAVSCEWNSKDEVDSTEAVHTSKKGKNTNMSMKPGGNLAAFITASAMATGIAEYASEEDIEIINISVEKGKPACAVRTEFIFHGEEEKTEISIAAFNNCVFFPVQFPQDKVYAMVKHSAEKAGLCPVFRADKKRKICDIEQDE